MISVEEFKKIEIRIGEILSAEVVPDSEKLVKMRVSFGDLGVRQIIAGIRPYFQEPVVLVGKKCPFVFNLEPRIIFGLESQGMILCASEEDSFSLLAASSQTTPGAVVR